MRLRTARGPPLGPLGLWRLLRLRPGPLPTPAGPGHGLAGSQPDTGRSTGLPAWRRVRTGPHGRGRCRRRSGHREGGVEAFGGAGGGGGVIGCFGGSPAGDGCAGGDPAGRRGLEHGTCGEPRDPVRGDRSSAAGASGAAGARRGGAARRTGRRQPGRVPGSPRAGAPGRYRHRTHRLDASPAGAGTADRPADAQRPSRDQTRGGGCGLQAVQPVVEGAYEAGAVLEAVQDALQRSGQPVFRLTQDDIGERTAPADLRRLVYAAPDEPNRARCAR